jgi:ATP-binding cassette subfamily G (WHITE) protein 1
LLSVTDEKMISEEVQVTMRDKPLKQLNRIAKRPKLDVEFQDLSYSVRDSNAKGGWRQILNSLNGKFRCGELTAILGPSGAGKSSLLNILAGFVTSGVKGIVKVNDQPRNMKLFNKLSSYIMQEDMIQPRLTVKEALTYAACLKLSSHIEYSVKLAVVDEVVDLLGLDKCVDTLSEHLSGGQRKRLSVALELVNNPPVIFLDEPTTGLDNFAIKQCIHLLKNISQLDRTVVCTIHQPPSSLFQFFDQVYIVADGYCVYNGSPTELVPFFAVAGYSCPPNNTPADYMIELVHSQPSVVQSFQKSIQNGKINMREILDNDKTLEAYQNEGIYNDPTEVVIQKSDIDFAVPFRLQFTILLKRMLLQGRRNNTGMYIQFFHHLLSALIVGGIFYGTGNDASQTIATFKYCVCINVFFMYTHVMLPVLLFPLEVKMMKREYFNRWYSLKAYYSALTVTTLPPLIILGLMFSAIVYFMTGQPRESYRFVGFCLMALAMAVTSQGLGYFIGSMFTITNGSVMGPAILAPLLALGVYGMGYRTAIEPFYKFAMTLTFVRNGIVGLCNTLFYKREPLECPSDELYCHYARPDVLMIDMAMPIMDYPYQLGMMVVFMVIFRIAAYVSLKCKLNNDLTSSITFYMNKIIKHRY